VGSISIDDNLLLVHVLTLKKSVWILGSLKICIDMPYSRINGGGIFQGCIGLVCWKVTIEYSKLTGLDEEDYISQA
jgi:hypothetical protein